MKILFLCRASQRKSSLADKKIEYFKLKLMFSGITWSDYVFACILILSGYYLAIIVLFYRQEIIRFGHAVGFSEEGKKIKKSNGEGIDAREEEMYHSLQELADGLRQSMQLALRRQYTKEQLAAELREQLSIKKELQSSSYKTAINNLIQTETKRINSISYSEQEVESLWTE